jgi:NarL family two-component system sensor histidine kinase LiaS
MATARSERYGLLKKARKAAAPLFSSIIPKKQLSRSGLEGQLRYSIVIVRYLLFIITSAFYLAGPPHARMHIKVVVVLTMLIATILAQNLYSTWQPRTKGMHTDRAGSLAENDDWSITKLIIVETIGIALLTIPTGGLNSPFIWYALNPIIIAAVCLPVYRCWMLLGLFIALATSASSIYPGISSTVGAFLYENTSTLFVFFLTTSLAQVAGSLYNRLGIAYESLAASHALSERSLEYISSLYQALEAFSSQEDRAQLAEVLASYAAKLCDRPAACYLRHELEQAEPSEPAILCVSGSTEEGEDIDWQRRLYTMWNQVEPGQAILISVIDDDRQLIAVPVESNAEYFGILAYVQTGEAAGYLAERQKSLTFLAELGGIVLERMKGDRLWGRLLVSEEQNRISNEIHDGIAQYLFSIVMSLHSISKVDSHIQAPSVQKQLRLIEETAKRASTELRASIYQLNPSKRGESLFVDNLASYLDDLGRLNGIKVDLQAEGCEELISPALRKILYRIVRESCSNAIRHGACQTLEVSLDMSPGRTILEIADDGRGLPQPEDRDKDWKPGLGIKNISQLVAQFDGELEIKNRPGRGTLVRCTIPKQYCTEQTYEEAII